MSRIVLSDRYELTEQIGVGSHCRVYLARDLNTNGLFACKKIDYGNAAVEIQPIIEREVQLTRQLDHPNIVKYYEIMQDDTLKIMYVIADYFKHGNLTMYCQDRRAKGMKIDEDSIWMIVAQLADVLSFCHSSDKSYFPELGVILHRNINPGSIYLKDDGTVVLGGFSLAEPLRKKVAAATRIGPSNYMSPEMLSNRSYDDKADVWALGCTIYEICTGEPLFKGADASEVLRELRVNPGPYVIPGYTEELCKVVSAMLEYNPDKRPSMIQLLQHPTVERMWQMYRGYLDVGVGVDNRDATENAATLHFNCETEDLNQLIGTVPCHACNRSGFECQVCGGTGLITAAPAQKDVFAEIDDIDQIGDESAATSTSRSQSKSKRGSKKPPKLKGKSKKSGTFEQSDANLIDTGMSDDDASGISRKKTSRSSSRSTSRVSSRATSRGAKRETSKTSRSRSNSAMKGCCTPKTSKTADSMTEERDIFDAPSILQKGIPTATNLSYEDVVAVQGPMINESNLLPGNRLATGYLNQTDTQSQFKKDGSMPPPMSTARDKNMVMAGDNYQMNVQSSFREGMINGHGRDIGTPMTNTPSAHSVLQESSMQYPQPTYNYQPVDSDDRVFSPGVQNMRLRQFQQNTQPQCNRTPTLTPPTDRPVCGPNSSMLGLQQSSYTTPQQTQMSRNESLMQSSFNCAADMSQIYYSSAPVQVPAQASGLQQPSVSSMYIQGPSRMQPVQQQYVQQVSQQYVQPVQYAQSYQPVQAQQYQQPYPQQYQQVHIPAQGQPYRYMPSQMGTPAQYHYVGGGAPCTPGVTQPSYIQTPGSSIVSPAASVYGSSLQTSTSQGLSMNASGRAIRRM